MYLTRVELNPYRRETMRALDSPQVMHAAVMASFNSFGSPDNVRVLWRVDKIGSATYVLIQSDGVPDVRHMIDQFGRPDTGQKRESLEYGDYLRKIVNGARYRFRLVANPVYSVRGAEGERGKIYPHVTVEQQLGWLLDRAEKHGFSLVDENGVPTVDIVSREIKKFKRGNGTVTVSYATYEGVLEVTDADLMRKSMAEGIGRAKSYGCGLLTVIGI